MKERDREENIRARSLVDVCESIDRGFSIIILDAVYCQLAMNRKIDCPYQSALPDKNGLYPCLNLKWNNSKSSEYH